MTIFASMADFLRVMCVNHVPLHVQKQFGIEVPDNGPERVPAAQLTDWTAWLQAHITSG
jgi:hypothetical protein